MKLAQELRDGTHQRTVEVTPLDPPFVGKVRFFHFKDGTKSLAVSEKDGEAIKGLLGGKDRGKSVTLEAGSDGRIRVRVTHA